MITKVIKVDPENIDYKVIDDAAHLLNKGQVVAFPTETVYGLGANALRKDAVDKIFKAKGRPSDNPLIVHIYDECQLDSLVSRLSEKVKKAMSLFWPGPLTVILDKKETVPEVVTAGLSTVAIRMPSHPVALALLKSCSVPIAAPSANRSGRPSPTKAEHVFEDMSERIPLIIDGGISQVGVESTVVDFTKDKPVILRPGGITKEMLSNSIGEVDIDSSILSPIRKDQKVLSPGMKYKHYAPSCQVVIIEGSQNAVAVKISQLKALKEENGFKVGVLVTNETFDILNDKSAYKLGSKNKPKEAAAILFESLRMFDKLGTDIVLIEAVNLKDEGLAVMNRMVRAAGFNIIKV